MTTTIEAPREALPEPLKVVAWTYTHKISEAGCVSNWRWPDDHSIREFYDEEHLVRLTDAQAALESERQAHAAEVERLRANAERYKLLRRGQHWSVIDGMGYTLRAEQIDAAIDQAIARGTK